GRIGCDCQVMKAVLADLFARFTAEIGQGDFACLQIARKWHVEDSTALREPIGAVLIQGVHDDGKSEPIAVIGLTGPHLTPADPALLQFLVRRAQVSKAPYILI